MKDTINLSSAYELEIARASTAKDLHALSQGIAADESLHSDERETLIKAIATKFGQMNLAAVGPQKPRW